MSMILWEIHRSLEKLMIPRTKVLYISSVKWVSRIRWQDKAMELFHLSDLGPASHIRQQSTHTFKAPGQVTQDQDTDVCREPASHENWQQWQTTLPEQFYSRDLKGCLKELTATAECHLKFLARVIWSSLEDRSGKEVGTHAGRRLRSSLAHNNLNTRHHGSA